MTVDSFLLATPGPAAARRSPLAHRAADLAEVSGPGLLLQELALEAALNLRADPGELPIGLPGVGQSAALAPPGWHALWLGPDEWLLLGGQVQDLLTGLNGGTLASLVEVSANYATLAISGTHARDLLEKAITLDLHPRSFSVGSCAQTTFARGNVVLWQTGADSYRLMFRPSFGTYFTDWLIDAAQEFR